MSPLQGLGHAEGQAAQICVIVNAKERLRVGPRAGTRGRGRPGALRLHPNAWMVFDATLPDGALLVRVLGQCSGAVGTGT